MLSENVHHLKNAHFLDAFRRFFVYEFSHLRNQFLVQITRNSLKRPHGVNIGFGHQFHTPLARTYPPQNKFQLTRIYLNVGAFLIGVSEIDGKNLYILLNLL